MNPGQQVGSDSFPLDNVERDVGVLQDLTGGIAPIRQDRLDSHADPGLVDRHHVLGCGLALGVDHSGGRAAGRATLGLLDGIALVKEGHGGHARGGENNAEGCQNSKNRARTEPGGGEGSKQPLSVVHQVVSFMGGYRWTYSYGPQLGTLDDEERNAPFNGYDCLSQTIIDRLPPSKNPLSSELIVCDVDSWLSIHSSNPTTGQDETIEFRNH